MLPWLLVIFAVSVAATAGGSANACLAGGVNDPVLPDGGSQRRDLPYRGRSGAEAFPAGNRPRGICRNTLQLGLCFLTSLLVSALIATPLLTTTSVMLVSILLAGVGYRLQQTPELAAHSSHA